MENKLLLVDFEVALPSGTSGKEDASMQEAKETLV